MSIVTNKSIFYHIPKTGGTWVNMALRRSMKGNADFKYKRPTLDYDNKDNYWKRLLSHSLGMNKAHETQWGMPKIEKEGLFSYSFVREPLSWYESYWASAKYMRDNDSPLWKESLLHFALEDTFEEFVRNTMKMFPKGALTAIYKLFLGENGDDLDFVGRMENLEDDLVRALTLAGETFNEKKIRSLDLINTGHIWKKDESFKLSKEVSRKLRKREKWVLDTFYK